MTKRGFIYKLRRGLGSAIIELKENPNRRQYRDTVLRCCLRDISYDWQSEGTKGYYLYLTIRALDDKEYFEVIIIDKFLSRCPDRLFLRLSAILSCYANDGSKTAKEAFRTKYNHFAAKNGRLAKNRSVDEGFQWDEVVSRLFCIDGFSTFKRYATDVGKILLYNPNNRAAYDDWFIARAENTFGKKRIDAFLNNAYGKSDAIKMLLDTLKADADSRERYQQKAEQERIAVEDLLKNKGLNSMALALLKENYNKSDDFIISGLINKSSRIPYHIQQDIRDIYCRHRSANALPILLRVYQKGDCSYCRNGIVEAMHHCRVLPDEVLAECRYDSYDDTRRFAKRLANR